MDDQRFSTAAQSLAKRAAAIENASDGEQMRSPGLTLRGARAATECPCPHLHNEPGAAANEVVLVSESSAGPPMKRRRSEMIQTEASHPRRNTEYARMSSNG